MCLRIGYIIRGRYRNNGVNYSYSCKTRIYPKSRKIRFYLRLVIINLTTRSPSARSGSLETQRAQSVFVIVFSPEMGEKTMQQALRGKEVHSLIS